MALSIRIVNAFFAALFLAAALVSAGFLTAALDGLGRGPEAVWLSSGWLALMLLFSALCFVNLRKTGAGPPPALVGANLAALLLAAAGLFAAEPVVRWIGGVSLLPFAATLAAAVAGRRSA